MNLVKFARRLMLGIPPLLPAYGMNLLAVFILNSIFHLSAVGIISTVLVGDVVSYIGGVALTPYLLIYFKKTKYFSKEELENPVM